jgi:hypothetical protein
LSGLEGVVYILVQGSTLFSSQYDAVNLLQLLWILLLLGVKPESIHAFLGNIENIDGWPSARVGLPSVVVPRPYRARVSRARENIARVIKMLFSEVLLDQAVHTVMFIYLNHGNPRWMGVAADEMLTIDYFIGLAVAAGAAGKRLLVVLDACYSTTFARGVWANLEKNGWGHRVAGFVGFLTSAETQGFTSAVLVSKQAGLVFENGSGEAFGEYAAGFRIQNSMFMRQLNDRLAYSLRGDRSMKVRDMPGVMNGPEKMQFGFERVFVGSDDGLGALALGEFFPGGTIDPELVIPEMDGRKFKAILPNARMLELEDDIG